MMAINSTNACLNEYHTILENGEVTYHNIQGKIFGYVSVPEIDIQNLQEKSQALFDGYQKTGSYEAFSDYAASLIYLGEYEKAEKIYLNIERTQPDLYTTASNLGTLYELQGDVEKALVWIKKSMQLNPQSHGGSEWIHVKILEYKLAGSVNNSASILGLDFGDKAIPMNSQAIDLEKTLNDIHHQLSERLKFVKPKNLIVGNLYFDYGNLLAQTLSVEVALEAFAEAEKFGFTNELMQLRIEKFSKIANSPQKTISEYFRHIPNELVALVLGFIAICVFVIAYIAYRIFKRK